MVWPPKPGEPLPGATSAIGVRAKLAAYSLNTDHGFNCVVNLPIAGIREKGDRNGNREDDLGDRGARCLTTTRERLREVLNWGEMTTVKHAIAEHDFVELLDGVGRWSAGVKGTVVSDYGDTKLVEIADECGASLDFIQIPESGLQLVSKYS